MEVVNRALETAKREAEEDNSFDELGCQSSSDDVENLQADLERRDSLLKELAALKERRACLDQLLKPIDEMMTLQDANKLLVESEKIFGEVKQMMNVKKQECIKEIASALEVQASLRETLLTLQKKRKTVQLMKEKYLDENVKKEKLSIQLVAVQQAHSIMVQRLKTKENVLSHLRNQWTDVRDIAEERKKKLAGLQKQVSLCKKKMGIKVSLVDQHTIQVQFPSSPNLNKLQATQDNDSVPVPDDCLIATLSFKQNQDGSSSLKDVQLNQSLKGSSDLIKEIAKRGDLPFIIMQLWRLWKANVPLVAEISYLRQRHAIDWMPEERTMRVMLQGQGSMVATLSVPPAYPDQGDVTLVKLSDCADTQDIQGPMRKTLTEWVLYLEEKYGRP